MDYTQLAPAYIRAIAPYQPGKPISELERELGITDIVKLASNENPLGPSPKAMAEYRRAQTQNSLYPEGASPELRKALADFHQMRPESILVGNGSDEVIRLLCEAFVDPEDEVVVSQYGFIRFKQQASMMGARVIEVPMTDWTHDLVLMAKATSPRTKLVFVANPNNPTGTYVSIDEIKRLRAGLPDHVLLVIDAAYAEFVASGDDKDRYQCSACSTLVKFGNVLQFKESFVVEFTRQID